MEQTSPNAQTTQLVRARWVLPVVGQPIDGGAVRIAAERIVEVGRFANEPAIDLGDVVLLPALVNAHTHLEFCDLTRPLGKSRQPLPQWIRSVIAERHRGTRSVKESIETGLADCTAAGVAAIGEIATASPELYASDIPAPAVALFHEVIGFSAARAESSRGHALERWDRSVPLVERSVGLWPAAGFSPHAPYTVHPSLVANLVADARRLNAPVAMHLAESPEEIEFLATGNGPFRELLEERSMWDPSSIALGSRPLDYLQALEDAPRALVVHGNYLSAEEIEWLGRHAGKFTVVFCPRTHAFFGHPRYPLDRLLASGVRVALGTDSRASTQNLDLLTDLRFAAAAFPNIPPEKMMRMATLDGAVALGVERHWGSLEEGKRADLLAIPCGDSVNDPYEPVLGSSSERRGVWRGGMLIVADL